MFHSRDLDKMAQEGGTAPVYIDALGTVEGGPIGGQTRVSIRNEHMSYIVTWWGFLIFYSRLFFNLYFFLLYVFRKLIDFFSFFFWKLINAFSFVFISFHLENLLMYFLCFSFLFRKSFMYFYFFRKLIGMFSFVFLFRKLIGVTIFWFEVFDFAGTVSASWQAGPGSTVITRGSAEFYIHASNLIHGNGNSRQIRTAKLKILV